MLQKVLWFDDAFSESRETEEKRMKWLIPISLRVGAKLAVASCKEICPKGRADALCPSRNNFSVLSTSSGDVSHAQWLFYLRTVSSKPYSMPSG